MTTVFLLLFALLQFGQVIRRFWVSKAKRGKRDANSLIVEVVKEYSDTPTFPLRLSNPSISQMCCFQVRVSRR